MLGQTKSRLRMRFVEPSIDSRMDFAQTSGKKMIRAFDDHEPFGF